MRFVGDQLSFRLARGDDRPLPEGWQAALRAAVREVGAMALERGFVPYKTPPWAVRELAGGAIVGSTRYHDVKPEADRVEILSGVFEGTTTGTPVAILIRNEDKRSGAYSNGSVARDIHPYVLHNFDNSLDAVLGFRATLSALLESAMHSPVATRCTRLATASICCNSRRPSRSSSSPASWPNLSLKRLKRSRSSMRTLTGLCPRKARRSSRSRSVPMKVLPLPLGPTRTITRLAAPMPRLYPDFKRSYRDGAGSTQPAMKVTSTSSTSAAGPWLTRRP